MTTAHPGAVERRDACTGRVRGRRGARSILRSGGFPLPTEAVSGAR